MSVVPHADDLATRLDRILRLTDALTKARNDAAQHQELCDRIRWEVDAARLALKPPSDDGTA